MSIGLGDPVQMLRCIRQRSWSQGTGGQDLLAGPEKAIWFVFPLYHEMLSFMIEKAMYNSGDDRVALFLVL